jgi:hypothetical protein
MFINKSLNLVGAGSGKAIVGLSQGKTNGVEVRGPDVSDVLIEGITFTRRDGADYASNFNLRFGETATTFDSLVLRDVEVAWAKGRNVYLDGNGVYNGVLVEDSSFHNAGAWGFSARGTINSMEVKDSNFDDNGWDLPANGIGFDIDIPTVAMNITVEGGSFSGNTKKGINLTNITDATFTGVTANDNEQGITLYEWRGVSSNVSFIDCVAHGNSTVDGFEIDGQNDPGNHAFTGILWRNTNPGLIANNDLHSLMGSQETMGILIYGIDTVVTVSGNEVTDFSRNGITAYDAQSADIEGNTILGRGYVGTGFWAQNGIQLSAGTLRNVKDQKQLVAVTSRKCPV